jgi:hypothetical protein
MREGALARLVFVVGRRRDLATNRATKLSKTQRTGPTGHGLSKPHELERTPVRRYRTQEVAGSSPASSIRGTVALHLRRTRRRNSV